MQLSINCCTETKETGSTEYLFLYIVRVVFTVLIKRCEFLFHVVESFVAKLLFSFQLILLDTSCRFHCILEQQILEMRLLHAFSGSVMYVVHGRQISDSSRISVRQTDVLPQLTEGLSERARPRVFSELNFLCSRGLDCSVTWLLRLFAFLARLHF